jgi:hypothetical protein
MKKKLFKYRVMMKKQIRIAIHMFIINNNEKLKSVK